MGELWLYWRFECDPKITPKSPCGGRGALGLLPQLNLSLSLLCCSCCFLGADRDLCSVLPVKGITSQLSFVAGHSSLGVFVPRCTAQVCSVFVPGNDLPREISLLISAVWLEGSEIKNGVSAVNRAGLFCRDAHLSPSSPLKVNLL